METTIRFKGLSPRDCGCKGIRTCLLCQPNSPQSGATSTALTMTGFQPNDAKSTLIDGLNNSKISQDLYSYCSHCGKAWLIPSLDEDQVQGNVVQKETAVSDSGTNRNCSHNMNNIDFPGIQIVEDFVNEEEEKSLDQSISSVAFVNSQSGRRKQDFGPKVNFKKRKLKMTNFNGLPSYSEFLYTRMTSLPALSNFLPVEMCNLEYLEERGAHIDPHFDDFWLWGERLVTVNLLSDSVLSFTMDSQPNVVVRVPMPQRSLIVVSGPARFEWKHSILYSDIRVRRLAMTFRELSAEFQEKGARHDEGQDILKVAMSFSGSAIAS